MAGEAAGAGKWPRSAGASYTATEQAMLNAIKTLVNQLRADLVAAGVIKGSA